MIECLPDAQRCAERRREERRATEVEGRHAAKDLICLMCRAGLRSHLVGRLGAAAWRPLRCALHLAWMMQRCAGRLAVPAVTAPPLRPLPCAVNFTYPAEA